MKVIKLCRERKAGSVRGIERIILTVETPAGEQRRKEYRLLRGAVTWPMGEFPGIVILGGREIESGRVHILEERPLQTVEDAVGAFMDLWAYRPSLYYYREDEEGEAFLSFLRGIPELRGKLPLVPALHAEAAEYGHRLIGEFLGRGLLSVPPEGQLAGELTTARPDMKPEEMPGVTALRYLLAGIQAFPWEEEIIDEDLSRCLA